MIRRRLEKWLRLPGPPVVFETERFVLRTLSRGEAARISHPWSDDPAVMENFELRVGGWTRRAWRRRTPRTNNRTRFAFGIIPRETGRIIGFETVNLTPSGVATLGVMIGDRDWWGRRVVVESRGAVLDFLFTKTACARAAGAVHARNLPSIANYLALGFQHEGTLRRQLLKSDGSRADSLVFGILRDEWLARRAGGEPPGSSLARVPGGEVS